MKNSGELVAAKILEPHYRLRRCVNPNVISSGLAACNGARFGNSTFLGEEARWTRVYGKESPLPVYGLEVKGR